MIEHSPKILASVEKAGSNIYRTVQSAAGLEAAVCCPISQCTIIITNTKGAMFPIVLHWFKARQGCLLPETPMKGLFRWSAQCVKL